MDTNPSSLRSVSTSKGTSLSWASVVALRDRKGIEAW